MLIAFIYLAIGIVVSLIYSKKNGTGMDTYDGDDYYASKEKKSMDSLAMTLVCLLWPLYVLYRIYKVINELSK